MQAFFDTGRVQPTNEGLYFYEKDIIMSPYLFNRDLKIDINFTYVRSGFGIVIAEDLSYEHNHSYLYHVGTNSFAAYERHLVKQDIYEERSNILKPEGQKVHLVFTFKKRKGSLYLFYTDSEGNVRDTLIGEHTVYRKISTYYVGFYSQAGNTINDVTFLQGIPERWHCSIANVHGGRISFWDEGFMFEDCIHDAELEQKEIVLPPGTFWFDYQTATVNGKYDIEGFVYESYTPSPPSDKTDSHYEKDRADFDERYLEDIGKALVHNQGKFTLDKETSVIVSFKGMNGRVDYICIKDSQHGEYISTSDKVKKIDGSWLSVNLTDVVALKWEGIIFAVPLWDDFSKPCPYAIMSTTTDWITLEALSIDLEQQYDFYYDVATSRLEAAEIDTKKFYGYTKLDITKEDNNTVKVFVNMKAQITNFILIMSDGKEININLQKTYKTFVPGYITGPIIVTDNEDNSFNISGSYREIVDQDNYHIDIFSQSALELKLTYHTGILGQDLQVFGIPKGASVDNTQTDIDAFCDNYVILSEDQFTVKGDIISVPLEIRNDYAYIAVRYQRIDTYSYFMTVYEREVFNGEENLLRLSSDINESGQGVIVYGIRNNSFRKEYLLRVPNKNMLQFIDLCADEYDMISSVYYDINTEEGIINLSSTLDSYDYFIVDYMRKNTYSVNWNSEVQQYEVDIASDETSVKIHYEMDDEGRSESIVRTLVKPDENKFVILKRNKGAFINED